MSKQFTMFSPNFWVGQTGRDLRAAGPVAMLTAAYLITNPLATYTGIYRLPVIYIANDLGLSQDEVRAALAAVEKTGFARYDERSEYVFIINAAAHQLGSLKASDNKVKYVNREFAQLTKNCPFIAEYFALYAEALHLKARADLAPRAPAAVAPVAAPVAAAPAAAPVVEVAAPVPEPAVAQPAPQPEAAPVVAAAPVKAPAVEVQAVVVEVENIEEAVAAYAEVHSADWKPTNAADDVAGFLARREVCGFAPDGAKRVAKYLLTFAANHGDYCTHQLCDTLEEQGDYDLEHADKYAKWVLSRADI